MFETIIETLSFGGGFIVIAVYGFLIMLTVGFLIHSLFIKLEKLGYKRSARAKGTGFYVNGDYMAPEELIDRARRTSDDFDQKITQHNVREAAEFMKAGGAEVKSQT